MKKLSGAMLSFAVLLGTSGGFAYDFSAIVTDSTKIDFFNGKFENPFLKQSEKFIGAFTSSLSKDGSSNFAAEATVEHKLDKQFGDDGSTDNSIVADCTLFKFSASRKLSDGGNFDLAAGRFFFSDVTGIVIAQPNDGFFAKYTAQKIEVSAYGGYSGLQNVKNVSVLTSNGTVWSSADEKDIYDFAAPYAIGSVCLSFPYFFKNQTVSIEGMFAANVSGPADLKDDDNRIYGTVNFTGPLSEKLFYSLSGSFGTTDFDKIGLLGKFSLDYFSTYKNAVLALNAVYASGESGKIGNFVGFTKVAACLSMDEPIYSGLIKAGASGSFIPKDKFVVSAGGDVVIGMPDGSSEFYGIQVSGEAMYKMYSDLNLSLSATHFVGKYRDASRTEITLGLALAL